MFDFGIKSMIRISPTCVILNMVGTGGTIWKREAVISTDEVAKQWYWDSRHIKCKDCLGEGYTVIAVHPEKLVKNCATCNGSGLL